MKTPGGQEIEIRQYAGDGKSLLLWLPSERGISEAHAEHARRLATRGHEVWLADLHDAYFIQRERKSIARFPLEDVIALIDAAVDAADAGLVLVSSSRGAQLALIAAREWQLRNPGHPGIRGAILLHPYLYRTRPAAGTAASYLPIVAATNLPLYLIHAQYSTKSLHSESLRRRLEQGGSPVFAQVIPRVQGGFHLRDPEDLEAQDRAARLEFALTLSRAADLLLRLQAPARAVASETDTREFSSSPVQAAALSRLASPQPARALQLTDIRGKPYDLDRSRGRVVLVNFWASWCKPCVDEIPSLHRLKSRISAADFDIVTVNVAEERERIERFLERVPIELPLLMDVDGHGARDWNIYVYPSSYLVDRAGVIRYAYLGGLEWDSTNNIAIIEKLLRESSRTPTPD